MIQNYFQNKKNTITEKMLSLDFLLIFLILSLGIISFFTMYSTEQGKFGYYTRSHIYRFIFFFTMFICFSFVRINFWIKFTYIFYIIVLFLLVGVDFFGVTASGSKRWINLFAFNPT